MKCEECGKEAYSDTCEDCCEHSDVCRDERCCLICGKDMTENLIAAAEGYGEDR